MRRCRRLDAPYPISDAMVVALASNGLGTN